jgi:hypothetical protein
MPTPPPRGDLPGGPKGENSGLKDADKLAGVSKLLNLDSATVTSTATSASALVGLLTSSGVDLSRLGGVLKSGDLLDVAA